ncbi:MAG TPA: translocation/assembly module TamB domain-containing protein [Planctomycetota bacterium]|nr:translocation/assembly module TamB domain-containing protein [Planctomycetota bacterium]
MLLLLGAGLWVARDGLARWLIEPQIRPALRSQLGADASWTSLDVHVTPSLSRVELRLRGLSLRGAEPGALLAEGEVDDVLVTLPASALLGEPTPQGVTITGARLVLDVREKDASGWPHELPPLDATGLAARLLLPGDRTLNVEQAELHAGAVPPAAPGQPLDLRAAGLQLVDVGGALDLGSASATLSLRPGVLLVAGRTVLLPPDGGSLALLDGARLELAEGGGPRLLGDVEVREVRLDRLLRGGAGAQAALLTLDATLDLPLATPGLHALLAHTQASLDARLASLDARDALTLRGRLADGVLTLEQAEASTRGGRMTWLPGRMVLGEEWLDTRVELRGRAELTDLGPLGALVQPLLPDVPSGDDAASWGGALRGWVDVSGVLRDPDFEANLTGSRVRVAGWLAGDLVLRAKGNRSLAHVDALELHAPGAELHAIGSLDPATLAVHDARADILVTADGAVDGSDARGPEASLPVRLARRLLPGVAGELELHLRAMGTLAAPVLELEACSPEVRAPGETLRDASLLVGLRDGVLRVADARADVHGTQVQVAGSVTGLPWAPSPGGLVVHLDLLSLQREELRLDLAEPAEIGWDGGLRISALDLAGAAGRAHVELTGEPAAGGLVRRDLVVRCAGVQLAVLPATLRPLGLRADVLDLDLHAAWEQDPSLPVPPEAPAPWLARARDIALDMELRAEQPALDVAGLAAGSAVLRGELKGDPSRPLGFLLAGIDDLRVRLPPAVADALRVLQGAGEVQTEEGVPQPGEVVLVGGSGRVPRARPAEPEAPRMFGPCDVGARVELGRLLGLQSLRLDDASGLRLDVGGQVSAPLDLRALAAGGKALVPDAALALHGQLTTGDVAALEAWLGDVRSLQGKMAIEGALEGTVGAPHLTGTLRISDAALSLASGLPAVESLQAVVALEQDEARVLNCTGELGSAPFELTGRVFVDGSDDALDLRLAGEDLLVWRGQGVKLRADVDLSLSGALARPAARGRFTLRDGRMLRNLNVLQLSRLQPDAPAQPLFSFREPPLSRLQLDLALDAAEPFRIENNLVRGSLVPHLHVGGTGAAPLVEGTIDIRPTRVALPGSMVDVTSGRLTFRADAPGRPDVQLAGQTRVRGWDVTITASGPYDEPLLQLESTPPLASEDVLLLLLTGQPPEGARDPSQASASAAPVAVYLGQDLLARWISDTSAEGEGPLDRFEMNYAENVTTRGTTSIQVSYRLQGETEGEGRAIYLDAEKDPYDAVNFGLRWRFRLP